MKSAKYLLSWFNLTRTSVLWTICLLPICWVIQVQPAYATTTCSYDFTTGSSNTYISYCITANGNILEIQTPFGQNMLGTNGEGYGVCNESPAQITPIMASAIPGTGETPSF
jgi:hypothetical protein